jgi:hypothetical protein
MRFCTCGAWKVKHPGHSTWCDYLSDFSLEYAGWEEFVSEAMYHNNGGKMLYVTDDFSKLSHTIHQLPYVFIKGTGAAKEDVLTYGIIFDKVYIEDGVSGANDLLQTCISKLPQSSTVRVLTTRI